MAAAPAPTPLQSIAVEAAAEYAERLAGDAISRSPKLPCGTCEPCPGKCPGTTVTARGGFIATVFVISGTFTGIQGAAGNVPETVVGTIFTAALGVGMWASWRLGNADWNALNDRMQAAEMGLKKQGQRLAHLSGEFQGGLTDLEKGVAKTEAAAQVIASATAASAQQATALQESLAQQQQLATQLKTENSALKEQVASLTSLVTTLRSGAAQVASSGAQLHADLPQMEQQLSQLTQQKQELDTANRALSDELRKRTAEFEQQIAAGKAADAQTIDALRNQNGDLQREMQQFKSAGEQLTASQRTMQEQLAKTAERERELAATISRLHEERTGLIAQIDSLGKEIARLVALQPGLAAAGSAIIGGARQFAHTAAQLEALTHQGAAAAAAAATKLGEKP
jgi:putative membrane protein